MKPPIPEPTVARPVLERGMRPPALKYFILGALLHPFSVLLYHADSATKLSVTAYLIVYLSSTAFRVVALWFCWVGHNWARIAIMVLCGITAYGFLRIGKYSTSHKVVEVVNLIFCIATFWWLRSPAMVAFSKGKPTPIQTVSALP